MSEPLGERINLREMFEPNKLRTLKKGDMLHFHDDITGEDNWIKVIRAGFLRYEGETVEEPKTQTQIREENERTLREQVDIEVEKTKPKRSHKKKVLDEYSKRKE